MNNRNFFKRLLTCLIGIPSIIIIIFLLNDYNFIGFSILCILISIFGSIEMSKLVLKKISIWAFLSAIPNIIQYLQNLYYTDTRINFAFFSYIMIVIISMSEEIFINTNENFKNSINNISKKFLVITYPSLFIMFIIKMLSLKILNSYMLLLFIILVFTNDISAYVFGCLFGKNNSGIIKVSPKKSIAGFIGGFICTILMIFLLTYLFKDKISDMHFIIKIILGSVISISANVGDLIESVFKRSANVKDSGNIFPGRGGILDSIDSIIVSAPFFYLIMALL